ncbi:MAG TPA: hypothetical protein VFO07_14580 [Roseiflexaceae bacterium]|nr:hypothetical protein [Roseiflexaceae bacterium]
METDRIKLDAAFYDLIQEVGGAIFSAMLAVQRRAEAQPDPPPPLLQLRRGYAESPAWLLVQIAEFDPEPLTVESLRVRHVYGSERMLAALLELMASEGWLDRDAAGAFHPTAAGRAQYQRLRPRQHRLIGTLEPPPEAQADRLADLLGRVIDAGLDSPSPPGAWCLAHSRRRAPAADAPALARIFHYSEDINAIRDDAHMAAWSPTGLKGYEWETFTHVWAGQADTAGMLFEQLNYRGYSRGEYADALAELARHGWLAPAGDTGAYQVTEAGRLMRSEVEQATDAYFYAPWSSLAESEIALAHDLLIRLRDDLQAI